MNAVIDDIDQRLMSQMIVWALTYDGYERLGGRESGPPASAILLEPAWQEFRRSGRIPEWCGVDLFRGWAFYLDRADGVGSGQHDTFRFNV